MLRALGFDPTNQEIVKLIRNLGNAEQKLDDTKIDFQEFLEIMIEKMVVFLRFCEKIVEKSEKDEDRDIDKAFNLFADEEKGHITFASLKRVVEDLGIFAEFTPLISIKSFKIEENMTDEQIWQLVYGANSKDIESLEEKDEKKLDPSMKKAAEIKENTEEFVTKEQFIRILKRYLNEEKKK